MNTWQTDIVARTSLDSFNRDEDSAPRTVSPGSRVLADLNRIEGALLPRNLD